MLAGLNMRMGAASYLYHHKWVRLARQLSLIMAVWLAGVLVCRVVALQVSPGIVGLFIMLALLGSGAVKMEAVEEGAKFVLGELVFFFLPIIVAVVKYKDLFIASGWQLLVCIFVGTVLVMLSTALTLSYCYKWRRRLFKRRHA